MKRKNDTPMVMLQRQSIKQKKVSAILAIIESWIMLEHILLMNEVLPTNVRFTLAKECHRNLSDIKHSTFKIGAVNRRPILFRPSFQPFKYPYPPSHPPLSLLPYPFRYLFSWAPTPLSFRRACSVFVK